MRLLRVCLFVLTAAVAATRPVDAAPEFDTPAQWVILMDAATQSVLFEKSADALMPPASMSKLMTLAVVFQALKEGRLKLTDEFTTSVYAWRTGGAPSGTSAMFVPLKESATVDELLQGIAVQSGNDACIILAEGIAGSEAAFADMMTAYGKKIGLEHSIFRNSTGLPHPDHMMTARDLAKLARYLIRTYPEYYHYFAQKEFKYRKHLFHNRNPLVYQENGVDGLKTGYTEESGYGITASMVQGDQRLIVVVNGLKSKKERHEDARQLLEWGFRNFKSYKLFNEGEIIGDALVWGGTSRFVELTGNGPITVLLPRSETPKLKASIVYQGPLKPPLKKGDKVAVLKITAADVVVNEIPLYAATEVEEASIYRRGFDSLLHLAFGWLL
ncbi:MAG: D-alanyl-D-alanine carboxypeptidase family protein [Pseudomonadota bacterium]|nr:D-alanyl-D-alanine carboxypeptidase family protein [Pseudomonadota bacterium]